MISIYYILCVGAFIIYCVVLVRTMDNEKKEEKE